MMAKVPVKIKRGLTPPFVAAWVPTYRTIVFAPSTVITARLLAHELCHVIQAENNKPWPWTYILQWMRSGFSYTNMPFEVEARRAEKNQWYLSWASDLLRDIT